MGKTFDPGDVPFAADLNNYLQAWAITVPTSVTNGTDVGGGIVEFTSQTAINLNGVFADAYRMYRVVVTSSGTASTLAFLMRTGASNSATNYDITRLLSANGAVSSTTSLNQTSGLLSGGMTNTLIQSVVDIARPNVALPTTMLGQTGVQANPAASNANNGVVTAYITHRPSTAYESLAVAFSAAQSGTVRVYGYK
jgi:hypothetical protein